MTSWGKYNTTNFQKHEVLLEISKKNISTLKEIWAKYLKRGLTGKETQQALKYMKRSLTSLIAEISIKTVEWYYFLICWIGRISEI